MTSSHIIDTPMNDIVSAQKTITAEIQGLEALRDSIDDRFEKAIETIQAMKDRASGRLIITGMGKSGHVGMKLAATFASTGTPASFVHPGEASHGDLGMITQSDVVLAISNSGEAPELSDIIAYTRRFAIPLLAMTAKPESSLGKHADIVLQLPQMPEACPNGLAPTTSTTATMALGDAIAIALLERMGLTSEQFKIFHPGGKLGAKLLPVSELMETGDALPLAKKSETMDQVILTMTEKNCGCVLVSDDGHNIDGIITDGDLKRHMDGTLLQKVAADIMTENPRTINAQTLAAEAVDVMLHKYGQPITSLVVVDDQDNLAGLLRLQALLAAGVA